jgi:glycosyltransferase involved in cell wall biosynthesis
MNPNGRKIHVLVTSAPPEAKGGIVALHRVLFGQPLRQNFRASIFPVSSPTPFNERWISRLFRILERMQGFGSLLVKDKSIKIIHINTSYDVRGTVRDAFFILISRVFGRKIVIQIHSSVSACDGTNVMRWIVRHIYSLGSKILVFTEEDRKKIAILVPKEKAEIFPNAVNVDEFIRKDNGFKSDQSIPEEGKIVLFISRLIKDKGVYDLIESIPSVVKENENAYFLFAGEGPEKTRMEAICRRKGIEGKVRFLGHIQQNDVTRAFTSADIFVLPARHPEGMPMAVLEALAAGLPIVSTPLGAIPDIVKDGINGFLVEPNAPEQIAEKIGLLLHRDDLKKKIREENIRLARREYDRDIALNKLEKLYHSL